MCNEARIVLVLAIGLLAACRNEQYCAGNPNNDCRLGDGPRTCSDSTQCTAPKAVCHLESCVQCTPDEAAACTGDTPVCGDDHQCRACSAHTECAGSDVCLPEGRCAAPEEVAYVQLNGGGSQPCAKEAPCGSLQQGITAVDASRPYIKISGPGTLTPSATTTIDGKAVTILADAGAKIDKTGDGVILEVRNTGADVRIYDLEITGASGMTGDVGISMPAGGAPKLTLVRVKVTNNQGGGISAAGGQLRIERSTIASNTGGGIHISGGATFDITNSFIYRNGDELAGTFGGLNLDVAAASTNRLAFNTIVDNKASINSGGVRCNVATLANPNNIIARNSVAGSTTNVNANELGDCTYPSSLLQADVSGLRFVDPEPPTPLDYRISAGSTAIDMATTPVEILFDHDGDPRPQGAQKDIGADEYRPMSN